MRYMVERNFVQVVGKIWQPGCEWCAMEYPLDSYAVRNIGKFTRRNVELWLTSHAGDFSQVIDFRASVGTKEIPWATEENECIFNDCMSSGE